MRVLLINPWEGEIYPPPAIGYLQAALKGVDVKAVDLSGAFKESDYDIVGVTFHSFSVVHARRIRDYYKCRLICGGHHPTALPEQMIGIGYDQVVTGEGEKAIVDIINGNTGPIIKGEVVDIELLPVPDYTGLKQSGSLPVISSRGCPFKCNFCGSVSFWQRYRVRSAESVLSELNDMRARGISSFMFEDDNFTAHQRRAIDICKGIKGMSWQCTSRAESLNDELCYHLKSAGCHTVWVGVESFSQATLDNCNKSTTVGKMIRGILSAMKAGLKLRCQFIVGLPGDTSDNIKETVSVIKRHKIRQCGANILWLLPGTEAYKRAKRKGFNDQIYLDHGAPYYTYEQDINTLQNWRQLIRAA